MVHHSEELILLAVYFFDIFQLDGRIDLLIEHPSSVDFVTEAFQMEDKVLRSGMQRQLFGG